MRDEPKEVVEFEIADRPGRGSGTDIGGGYRAAVKVVMDAPPGILPQ